MAVEQNGRPLRSPRDRADEVEPEYFGLGEAIGDRRALRGEPWAAVFDGRAEHDDLAEAFRGLLIGRPSERSDAVATIRWWLFRRLRAKLERYPAAIVLNGHGRRLVARVDDGALHFEMMRTARAIEDLHITIADWLRSRQIPDRIAVVSARRGIGHLAVSVSDRGPEWRRGIYLPGKLAEHERLMRGMPWAERPFFDRPGSSIDDE